MGNIAKLWSARVVKDWREHKELGGQRWLKCVLGWFETLSGFLFRDADRVQSRVLLHPRFP